MFIACPLIFRSCLLQRRVSFVHLSASLFSIRQGGHTDQDTGDGLNESGNIVGWDDGWGNACTEAASVSKIVSIMTVSWHDHAVKNDEFPPDRRAYPVLMWKSRFVGSKMANAGAGNGDRTRITSLEG